MYTKRRASDGLFEEGVYFTYGHTDTNTYTDTDTYTVTDNDTDTDTENDTDMDTNTLRRQDPVGFDFAGVPYRRRGARLRAAASMRRFIFSPLTMRRSAGDNDALAS